ncbi:hypothetical protein [Hymenobacter sp. YC55]|uniref:hypothetical protein n=1 Tax=Hymenobacter sp. YC55 TaxID=3034019 RepID=UPI0023F694A0|nr:hypothetical protein [Hymenobacter sp. YC55]MDF7815169.1 hypothetical protein [Hymenobacter sp. YC55]
MAKSKKAPQSQGRCMFCGGTGLTKQHLWPDWLNDYVPRQDNHGNLKSESYFGITPDSATSYTSEPAKKVIQGSLGSRKLRQVCEGCNGGWMSKIEEGSKNTILSLMNQDEATLTRSQQFELVSWITLMTMVNEFTDLPMRAIPYRERQYLLIHRLPPSDWNIWIGRHQQGQSEDWTQMNGHHGYLVASNTGEERGLSEETTNALRKDRLALPKNVQSSTFCIKGLVLVVLSSVDPAIKGELAKAVYPDMVKIWPADPGDIIWSQIRAVPDEEMQLRVDYIETILKNYVDRMNAQTTNAQA